MKTSQKYKIALTTTSPLHVGGLDDPLGAEDNPVALIGGQPCIPGPSLKGALRAEIERFLIDRANGDSELLPCLTTTEPSPGEKALAAGERKIYRPRPCSIVRDSNNENRGHRKKQEAICPACYILGAQGLVGFASVPFLMAVGDLKPESLYSSRIDRVTGTVASGNRSYQVIKPGARFEGEMDVLLEDAILGWSFGTKRPIRNRDGEVLEVDQWLDHAAALGQDQEGLLKSLVLERLESINLIGGYRSKGFGAVAIKVEKVQ